MQIADKKVLIRQVQEKQTKTTSKLASY